MPKKWCPYSTYLSSSQLARIMAIIQQQRQQQQVGVGGATPGGGNPKLSPSHIGGGVSKQSMVDPLPHAGMGGNLPDLHAKSQGMYSGRSSRQSLRFDLMSNCPVSAWIDS